VENRARIGTWRPAVGQRIAVHAGKLWSDVGNWDMRVVRAVRAAYPNPGPRDNETVLQRNADVVMPAVDVRGAIIGTVEVVDVHPDAGCSKPWGRASKGRASG